MTQIVIGDVTYKEQSEYPNRTDFINAAVDTTAPEGLSIAQSWNKKAFGKRTMTVSFTKGLPHTTVNGGTFVEVISLATKLTHIPDYLSSDKSNAIATLFSRANTLFSDSDVIANLSAGIHNASYTISTGE